MKKFTTYSLVLGLIISLKIIVFYSGCGRSVSSLSPSGGSTPTPTSTSTPTPTPTPTSTSTPAVVAFTFTQQGGKLVGTQSVGTPNQGIGVALSSDGNTALVGGQNDNSGAGAVWFYTRSGGVWNQQGTKVSGTSMFGSAVALSADGNTAIIGAQADTGSVGAAWIYTQSGGVWTPQGGKLTASDSMGSTAQGLSVAISGDGNTVLVGGPGDNSHVGAAWVYTRSGGVWTQQGNKLTASDAVGHPWQGRSVALSGDGNTALVGGHQDSGNVGAAWVYTRSGGVWTQQTKLVGTGIINSPCYQGYSVALSSDGNTALVGATGDNSGVGAAWVFTRSGGVWTQQVKLVGTGISDFPTQGTSVSLSSDGNTAIIGGPHDDDNTTGLGAGWVFTRSGGVWTQQSTKLLGTGAAGTGPVGSGGVHIGSAVAVSGDASTFLLGGPYDNTSVGAVWVFIKN